MNTRIISRNKKSPLLYFYYMKQHGTAAAAYTYRKSFVIFIYLRKRAYKISGLVLARAFIISVSFLLFDCVFFVLFWPDLDGWIFCVALILLLFFLVMTQRVSIERATVV